ncbi:MULTISPECIES: radical SAM protein [Peptoniphilaceae]|uniref:Radical SAM domain protein n=2 Tax=Peptoniphilus lacrimalis TaxID=33031 RepID=D1VRT6_9FIRM|nr:MULTISPECIES: radical SAM protein [Peptoniphilaceae]EFA90726.1 radical SAM domain protein [Peptoniphilus lacrimalis 315-B]KGF36769.1 methyltransferase [Peptoniphilus lacrimalis DNF00528]MDK8281351.1 radical SAM protein [Peptoniphilus lacrimalis]SUB57937.1 coproporphyrinogen III oxidase [Peptoniphilus lacrimalis]
MQYYGNVFRPPSEARSLIIQATVGCAHNKCSFCYMYKDDNFIIRPLEDIKKDLIEMSQYGSYWRRIFLADGDALVLKTSDLLEILKTIKQYYPNIERVSSYATAGDINRKSIEELKALRDAGLEMLYIGFESGDDEILRKINKGLTYKDYVSAMAKCKEVGFKTSITIIAGLGGVELMEQNAKGTAKIISETKPDYVSYLTMRIYKNTPLYLDYINGKFNMPNAEEILQEMKIFLENVDSEGTIFRSNHASNYVLLAGTLNEDKKGLIEAIDKTLKKKNFVPEVLRGF